MFGGINLLEEAINSNDGDHAAKVIQEALGIESDEVANYVFPKTWPNDREQRARIIGEWLQTEAAVSGRIESCTETLARHVDRSHRDGGGGLECSCG